MITRFFLIATVFLFLVSVPCGGYGQIVVENAGEQWEGSVASATFPDIPPRIVFEYGTTMEPLPYSSNPDLPDAEPRIIVEYATNIAQFGMTSFPGTPQVTSLAFDSCVSELCSSSISVTATDPLGGNLSFVWSALNGGSIIGSGPNVQFDPPNTGPHPCPYQVEVTISSDNSGMSTSRALGIYVKRAGDVNGDGRVDVLDRLLVRNHFGETPASPGWDPRADVNCDGRVDVLDRLTVRNQFGQTGCACQ